MNSLKNYLVNLTPLRGLAAVFTVIFHFNLMIVGGALIPQNQSSLISKMYLMVDFFFVLSGFILMHVYSDRFNNSVNVFEFKKFTIARFARIYPLHFFTLLYLVALHIWFISAGGVYNNPFASISNRWEAIPTNLLLIQSMNIHNWFSWNNSAWSISTEWWMYMLFPFLVKPFFKLNSIGQILILVACFTGYLLIIFYIQKIVALPEPMSFIRPGLDKTLNVAYDWGFLRCMFGFIIGMITYLAFKDGIGRNFWGNGITFSIISIAIFLCLHFGVLDVFTVSFFPLLILSGAYGSKNIDSLFALKPLQRLGDWSYSIYLVHQPILYTFGTINNYLHPQSPEGRPPQPDILTGWLICLFFIVLTLVISFLTYRFIEVPARNWINRQYGSKV